MDELFLNKVSSVLGINRLFINKAVCLLVPTTFPRDSVREWGGAGSSTSKPPAQSCSSLLENPVTERGFKPPSSLSKLSWWLVCTFAQVEPGAVHCAAGQTSVSAWQDPCSVKRGPGASQANAVLGTHVRCHQGCLRGQLHQEETSLPGSSKQGTREALKTRSLWQNSQGEQERTLIHQEQSTHAPYVKETASGNLLWLREFKPGLGNTVVGSDGEGGGRFKREGT